MKLNRTVTLFAMGFGLLALGFSCNEKSPETITTDDDLEVVPTLTNAFPALTFSSPVELVHAGDGSNRLFVVEQRGVVKVFKNEASTAQTEIFLDISGRVTSGGETGLLGLAFHPDFKNNGQLFVNYTRRENGQLQSVIARFQSNKTTADASSEEILLTYNQPYSNHNGGSVLFGKDGFLYIATGDGGSGGDPQNYAQNLGSLLGKMLRIDVNKKENGLNYAIPADNPFKNTDNARPEIYAYGLRNPWKVTADRENGRFWIADVGQNAREEIDILERGGNYGWRIAEGKECYSPAANCNRTGLVEPIFDYGTSEGRSITGGYVYRGAKLVDLKGQYIYGDFVSGKIWALQYNETSRQASNKLITQLTGSLSSFGEDEAGELYLLNYQTGKIQQLTNR
ncbi:PQQ-dependent sugar dehydrogenase [Runella salmonicolor]|uniref:PQQ-dependent sugar dehydrogenase n=1 Tax=Runella salmonicolor TaxID=2950278 RepID=A0ABT1FV67_9BACT|nr:PQQ-dependent sugar dehydrogenase [Runella salmonicolor]MCP1385601.1 PQQ-dependent sugar dehydrogenase [Runella salmonicolor]